ncbi:hypothetical protein FI667_g17553, partial [Globisporangium splendens]
MSNVTRISASGLDDSDTAFLSDKTGHNQIVDGLIQANEGVHAAGIDFRQNVKNEGKRKYEALEASPFRNVFHWHPSYGTPWDVRYRVHVTLIENMRPPEELDETDFAIAPDIAVQEQ